MRRRVDKILAASNSSGNLNAYSGVEEAILVGVGIFHAGNAGDVITLDLTLDGKKIFSITSDQAVDSGKWAWFGKPTVVTDIGSGTGALYGSLEEVFSSIWLDDGVAPGKINIGYSITVSGSGGTVYLVFEEHK